MANKKMTEFTLVDVIERQIHFIKTNTLFDRKEYETYNEGSLLALNEMLADVEEMSEDEFTNKYLNILRKLADQFEEFREDEFKDEGEVDKLSGYNNSIVSIMMCINPHYQYPSEDWVHK